MSKAEITQLTLSQIQLDGGTQSRAKLCNPTVDRYAEKLKERGYEFDAIVVFYDGKTHWMASGFHRWHAYQRAGRKCINAQVIKGTQRDAILYSVGANDRHGLQRTDADKRFAVRLLLTDAEWSKWGAPEIAKRCNVSTSLVRVMKEELKEEKRMEEEKRQASLDLKTSEKPAASSPPPAPPPPPTTSTQTTTYRTKHGTVAQMNTGSIGKSGGKNNNMRPIVVETEPAELAKIYVKEKRSGVKYVRQIKQQGKTLEYALAEVRRIWEELPIAED